MKPVYKVLIVVAIVLISVQILKNWQQKAQFIPWIHQEFETVPPQPPFTVTPSPLVVNADLTARPVTVATAAPMVVETVEAVETMEPVPVRMMTVAPTGRTALVASTKRPVVVRTVVTGQPMVLSAAP